MPEVQVSKGIEGMVNRGKGMDSWMHPDEEKYRLEIVPVTHSKKQVTLLSVNAYTYSSPTLQPGWVSYAPQHWIDRAEEDGLSHLMAIVPPAPLICRSRGKLLCMAAGPHALVVCLALETNVIGMSTDEYRSIVRKDYAGPNPDRDRATKELRVFRIPDRYRVPYSSKTKRTIKIVAAFVSDHWTWVINDFSSLLVMNVFSRNVPWTASDISPGTRHWKILFGSFKGGPHWTLESDNVYSRLLKWRHHVLTHPRPLTSSPSATRLRPILSEILINKFRCFAGIGHYSANDLLHMICLYPATPSHVICEDPDLFRSFAEGIRRYVDQFSSPRYLQRATSVPNTRNPFSFNEHFNSEFLRKWVLVYRRNWAVVPVTLYNKYVRQGLLDRKHTIGMPYKPKPRNLLDVKTRKWAYVPVLKCKGPGKFSAYTIIQAKTPPEWGSGVKRVHMKSDLKGFIYATTLGMPQFQVHVLNRPNYRNIEPGLISIGRPCIYRTGKAGRPRKGMTKKSLKKMIANQKARVYK